MVSDEEYLKLLDNYNYSYRVGDVVEGTVVSYDSSGVLVDIRAKTLALCPAYEIINDKGAPASISATAQTLK